MQRRKYRNVGIVVIDEKNRILLTHQSRGWNAPGGKIELSDASVFLAAKREFAEEVTMPFPFSRAECKTCVYTCHKKKCLLFYNIKPITVDESNEIIQTYDRTKVKYQENNDITFYSITDLINLNPIITGHYKKKNRPARFMKRVCKIVLNSSKRW